MKAWLFVLIILVLAGGTYLLVYLRIRIVNRQKKLLEERVAEQTRELRDKNDLLVKQAEELNETNTLLEERQQQIEEQSEELLSQSEYMKMANDKLEELNKSKDKFFSIIAHDLRSPFNTIFGFAELLEQKQEHLPDDKRKQYISALYTSAKRVYTLLENLLQWSRSQTNRISLEPRNFFIKGMVEDIYDLQEETLRQKSIQFEIKIDDDAEVYADYEMIQVVLRNLISNAIKFTPGDGKITLEVKKKAGRADISVKDTGIGMDDDTIENLFKIDRTITTSGTDGEKGSGLGLLLCKDFVEKNGGKMQVKSNQGEGSDFSFTLPLAQ